MSERLLSVDAEPQPGITYRCLRLAGNAFCIPSDVEADDISAELDRLYAAAEANQAPGPDWKAKLRPELIDALKRLGDDLAPGATAAWSAEVGADVVADWRVLVSAMEDLLGWVALPDPPTPDPDAPPVYVPPEGHVAPVRGENVPDGWEGHYVCESGYWWDARTCRAEPNVLFEVRRVPAPEPATEWVPLTKLVGRTIKGETEPVHRTDSPNPSTEFPGWRWRPISAVLWQRFPDGTLNIDTAQVLVLAEGER